jgi:hypothetical protein
MAYIGKTPVVGNFQVCDAISVVNGQAAYTLQVGSANVIPESANHMIVSLNGVIQKPGSSFTVSGSTMTFASNLATGDSIDFVQILGNVLDIGTPSDATVTTAKLGSNAVTSAKLSYPLTTFSSTGIDDNADATAITIDSSERVGIGTASPSANLEVRGASSNGQIYLGGSTTATYGKFYSDNDGTLIASADGGNNASGSSFRVEVDGTERMRIESNGFTKHSNTGVYDTYSAADDAHQFVSDNQTHSTLWVTNTNASYSDIVQKNETARGPNSAFSLLTTTTGNLTDDQHRLRGDGNAYCDGSWNGGGADYAEYFEWSDGNTNNEDRVGYSVVLEENKIRKATSEDNASNIIGVVSGNPFVVGDDAWSKWHEKYLKDDFGRYILEEYTITEWEKEITQNEEIKKIKVSFETDKIPSDEIVPENATVLTNEVNGEVLKRRILNTNFDETSEYITREDRKEWDTVGLLGKLRIKKGQPVGDRWIKMRDISETVEEWLIR